VNAVVHRHVSLDLVHNRGWVPYSVLVVDFDADPGPYSRSVVRQLKQVWGENETETDLEGRVEQVLVVLFEGLIFLVSANSLNSNDYYPVEVCHNHVDKEVNIEEREVVALSLQVSFVPPPFEPGIDEQ
jgi:hypothetical protein